MYLPIKVFVGFLGAHFLALIRERRMQYIGKGSTERGRRWRARFFHFINVLNNDFLFA